MQSADYRERMHCVELVTGKHLTGTLELSEERIHASIYSYTGFFNISGEQPIILQTEANDIVSLHSNITTVPGKHSRVIKPRRTVYQQEIISNLAIVGHNPWMADDKIKRATFSVDHTKKLMLHDTKIKEIGRTKYPEDKHFNIFTAKADGMMLKASYNVTYGMDFDAPKEIVPCFEIEFDEPCSITDYIFHVMDYVRFLSFCLGAKLKPSKIHIDRLSFAEAERAIESQAYSGNHIAHYIWPATKIDSMDLWVGGAPVLSWDDGELNSLQRSLVAWINRAPAWRKASSLMMSSFGLRDVISAERLLNACRWFEDIPTTEIQNALSDQDIDAISAIASIKAEELGYDPTIRNRIANALKWVKAESAEERFRRLGAVIKEKFGAVILPDSSVEHLKRAIQFRAKAAHGRFNPKDDAEFRAFSKSIKALEALCYLLTALGLPISENGKKRIMCNPIIRDYLACDR
jgi:hypothetical protein